MAASVLTLFASNPEQSGSSAGLLTPTAPAASTSTTGWTVGTTVINRWSTQTFRTEKAAATFSAVVQPQGPPRGLGMDCFRSEQTRGDFSAGTWYSSVSVIAVTNATSQRGAALFRVWKTPNLDGSSGFSELVTDQFTRADQNPLAGNWTRPGTFGDLRLLNTAIKGAGAGDNGVYYNAIAWPANQVAECRVDPGIGTSDGGPAVRMQTAAASCYALSVDSSTPAILINRFVAGALVTLQNISGATLASTDSIGIEAIGSTIRAYKNRVQIGTDVIDTTAALATGNAGMFISGLASDFTIDNWAGGTPTLVEITKSRMTGSTLASALLTTAAQSSSASTQIAAFSLNNEYLFWQVGWMTTTVATNANADVLLRIGSLDATSGTGLVTSAFSVTVLGGGGGGAASGGQFYYNLMQDWFNR